MRVWDTIIVEFGGLEIPVAVEYSFENDEFKILGIELIKFNPVLLKKPEKDEEILAVEYIKKRYKGKDILKAFGKRIKIDPKRVLLLRV